MTSQTVLDDSTKSANVGAKAKQAAGQRAMKRSAIIVTLLRPSVGTIISPNAWVNGVGWIDSDSAVSEVLIRIGGHIFGTARLGVSPAELATLIDQFPDGPATGFAFTVIASGLKPGPTTMRLSIRTAVGRVRHDLMLMVATEEARAIAGPKSALVDSAAIDKPGILHVENLAGLDIERLICSRNGIFAITGRAVAEAGVAEIGVELDGEFIGTMRLDEARADCAPASRPGFRLVRRIPPPRAERVQLRLTVLGRDESRRVCHRDIPVVPRAWS